jgi:hypothetical protein
MLRRIFDPKRQKITGLEKLHNEELVICVLPQRQLG